MLKRELGDDGGWGIAGYRPTPRGAAKAYYSFEAVSIVWTGGAVTTDSLRSGVSGPDLSRISLYSWQMAHKWQKK